MSVKFSDVKPSNIRTEEGTPGGVTYYVRIAGQREEKALCFRRMHSDHSLRCTNPAGAKTWHNGTGACAFHGGQTSASPVITTGRNAPVTKQRLADSIQKYMQQDRGKLMDLTEQLATSKAIFDEFVEGFPTPTDDSYSIWLNRFLNIIGSMGNLVEKMSRIDNRNTLNAAQVLYLRATVADILMKYLADPYVRERAAKELASRLGGDMSVSMQPSEVYLPGKIIDR